MPDPKRVVVVGGGAAGVFTAYLLEKNAPGEFDVTVLEKNPVIGGNTRGEEMEWNTQSIHVDCGAQFFYETSEPEYCDMLREEGFFDEQDMIIEKDVGITLWNRTDDRVDFHIPADLGGILASVVLNPIEWLDFVVFTTAAIEKYFLSDWKETFGEWIDGIPFADKDSFVKYIARPLMYQFGLVDPDKLDDLSAKFVVYYYVTTLPWPVDVPPSPAVTPAVGTAPFKLYTLSIGADQPARKRALSGITISCQISPSK